MTTASNASRHCLLLIYIFCSTTHSFSLVPWFAPRSRIPIWRRVSKPEECSSTAALDPNFAKQFKIVTCNASACAEKRKRLGLDPYATFSDLYVRANPNGVVVEEASCLGACQQAPCVGVQHEEYEGTVALNGMTNAEFANRVFFRVMGEDDAERVWQCVADGVKFMEDAAAEEEGVAQVGENDEQDRFV